MTLEDASSRIEELIQEADNWRESYLEEDQREATNYYHGEDFGIEEEGRSKVKLTDVRDTWLSIKPSLMRIFFNAKRVVEFEPTKPEDAAAAEQRTDYINHIITQDNPGFQVLSDAFDDAGIRKIGFVKWWWEDGARVEAEEFTGLTEGQVLLLMAEPNVEVQVDAMSPAEDELSETTFDVTAMRFIQDGSEGRCRIQAVPPEEILWAPQTRSIETCPFLAHHREMAPGEAEELGIHPDLIDEFAGRLGNVRIRDQSGVAAARRIDKAGFEFSDTVNRDNILVTEVWMPMDFDDDGVTELRYFLTIGPNYEIVENRVVSERPFAAFVPIHEAHTLVGQSIADLTMDIQLIKSQIARGMLDSLAAHLYPERIVEEGRVNLSDLMNKEVGKVIRVDRVDAIRDIEIPFVGADAMPVMEFFDRVGQQRTGQSAQSQGLDADALQSTTKEAAASAYTKAQERIEFIARTFAETGMARLMKGIQGLVMRHQDRARMVKLRGEYVEVDPRYWEAELDTRVAVGIGQGRPESQIQVLAMIGQKQQELMQTGAPFVNNVHLRSTLAKMAEIAGYDPQKFFAPWSDQDEQAHQQALAQQPPPFDPQKELIEIEKQKFAVETANKAQEFAAKREEMLLKDDRERDAQAQEAALKEMGIEAQYNANLADAEVRKKIAERRRDNS